MAKRINDLLNMAQQNIRLYNSLKNEEGEAAKQLRHFHMQRAIACVSAAEALAKTL